MSFARECWHDASVSGCAHKALVHIKMSENLCSTACLRSRQLRYQVTQIVHKIPKHGGCSATLQVCARTIGGRCALMHEANFLSLFFAGRWAAHPVCTHGAKVCGPGVPADPFLREEGVEWRQGGRHRGFTLVMRVLIATPDPTKTAENWREFPCYAHCESCE